MAVGIKQNELVNKVIQKVLYCLFFFSLSKIFWLFMYKWMILIAEDFQFPLQDFVVMLFHYDGVLDDWNQYPWSAHAIHVSVMNQTKWSVSCNSCNSYIYQNNNWMMLMWQVVRQTILASWCSCRVWIYFPLGRRSRCRSFQSSTVDHQYFYCFFVCSCFPLHDEVISF